MTAGSAQRKYPEELRERATRLAVEARRDPERSKGAIRRIADELGVHPEALRTWVKKAEIDAGARPGTTSQDAQRIRELEKEVRELRRANGDPAQGGARMFAPRAECEAPVEVTGLLHRRATRRTLGPVPICQALTSAGVKIAPTRPAGPASPAPPSARGAR
ncbi:transposase [Actinomyces procaprae]|uniref:transposase n=1 Tax=Actinomyces procaprae TaxID=2560010 RepID=UPI001B34B23C|nr:transposase [Actinomyces procaprae]